MSNCSLIENYKNKISTLEAQIAELYTKSIAIDSDINSMSKSIEKLDRESEKYGVLVDNIDKLYKEDYEYTNSIAQLTRDKYIFGTCLNEATSLLQSGIMPTCELVEKSFEDKRNNYLVEMNRKYKLFASLQERKDIEAFKKDENLKIPLNFDFSSLKSLSAEVVEKLNHHRPANIGMALRIQGITPASIISLAIALK